MKQNSFSIYSSLIALGTLFHFQINDLWLDQSSTVFCIVGSFVLLLKPTSIQRYFSLCLFQLWDWLARLPDTANHWMFLNIVNLFVVIYFLIRFYKDKKLPENGEEVYADLKLPLFLSLMLLYFLTGIHKLNYAFFDPEVSCATRLFVPKHGVGGSNHLQIMGNISVAGTLFVELVAPLLFFVPVFFKPLFFFCVLFHLVIGTMGIYDFSTFSIAILALFYLRDLDLTSLITNFIPQRVQYFLRPLVVYWPAIFITLSFIGKGRGYLWGVMAIGVLGVTFKALLKASNVSLFSEIRISKWPLLIWIPFGILIVVNGMSPYLGIKTTSTFSMFSNLRIGLGSESNHFIFKNPISPWHSSFNDWIIIEESNSDNLQDIARQEKRVSYYVLKSYVQNMALEEDVKEYPLSVSYVRKGERYRVKNAFEDKTLMEPNSWLGKRFISHRPYDPAIETKKAACKW